jgi:predicted nuclease of predicted toxin-antitoxin system
VAVKYLLDGDLPSAPFSGLKREDPRLDVLRVQKLGLRAAEDQEILAHAAAVGRIVVSKDKDDPGNRLDTL